MKKFCVLFAVFALLTPSSFASAQSVDILWQGDTYTPPFYKGRPLWSNQSRIILYAVPQIPGTNPSSLNYKWTKNSVVLGTANGIGKNTLIFSDSVLGKPQEIKLEILSSDGAILASNRITVSPSSPKVLAYENNPLYGILFNREAGSNYRMIGDEISFTAFPLFFSVRDLVDSRGVYAWTTNTGGLEIKSTVIYRVPEGASGNSEVTIRVKSADRVMQSAEKDFLVEFGNR